MLIPVLKAIFKVYAMILEWEQSYYISLSYGHFLFSLSPLPFSVSQLRYSNKYSQAGKAWVLPLSATVLTTGCPTEVGMALSAQCELSISASAGCLSQLRVICSKHIY